MTVEAAIKVKRPDDKRLEAAVAAFPMRLTIFPCQFSPHQWQGGDPVACTVATRESRA